MEKSVKRSINKFLSKYFTYLIIYIIIVGILLLLIMFSRPETNKITDVIYKLIYFLFIILSLFMTLMMISSQKDFLEDNSKKINYLEIYSRLLEVEKEKLNLLFYFFKWIAFPHIYSHDTTHLEEWKTFYSEIENMQLEKIICINEIVSTAKTNSLEFNKFSLNELNIQFKKLEALDFMVKQSLANIDGSIPSKGMESILKERYPDIEIKIIYPSESLIHEYETIVQQNCHMSEYLRDSFGYRGHSISHFFTEDLYEYIIQHYQ